MPSAKTRPRQMGLKRLEGSFSGKVETGHARLRARVQEASGGGIVSYVLEATVLCFLLKLPTSLLARLLFPDSGPSLVRMLIEEGRLTPAAVVYVVLLAPAWETAVGQVAPVALVRRLGGSPALAVAASVTLFELMHSETPAEMLTVLPVGIVLGVTCLLWSERDWGTAYAVTAGVLVMHNAIAVGLPLAMLQAGNGL
jgi:hypothetical protein